MHGSGASCRSDSDAADIWAWRTGEEPNSPRRHSRRRKNDEFGDDFRSGSGKPTTVRLLRAKLWGKASKRRIYSRREFIHGLLAGLVARRRGRSVIRGSQLFAQRRMPERLKVDYLATSVPLPLVFEVIWMRAKFRRQPTCCRSLKSAWGTCVPTKIARAVAAPETTALVQRDLGRALEWDL